MINENAGNAEDFKTGSTSLLMPTTNWMWILVETVRLQPTINKKYVLSN